MTARRFFAPNSSGNEFPWWHPRRYVAGEMSDYAATYGAALIAKVRGFLIAALLVRYEGFATYGAYSLGGAISQIAMTMALFGTGTALVLEWPRVPQTQRRSLVVRLITLTSAGSSVIVLGWAVAAIGMDLIVQGPTEAVVATAAAAGAVPAVLLSIAANVFRAQGYVKPYALGAPLRFFAELAGLGLGILVYRSLFLGLVLSLSMQLFASALFFYWSLRQVPPRRESVSRTRFRGLLRNSVAIASGQIGQDLVNRGDRLVIGAVIGSTGLGIYSAAYAVASVVYSLLPPMTSALLPHLRDIWHNDRKRGMIRLNSAMGKFSAVIISISFAIVFFRETAIAVFVGNDNVEPVSSLVPILLAGTLIYVAGRILNIRYILDGRAGRFAVAVAAGGIVNLVGAYILGRSYGLPGAALATVIGYLVLTLSAVALVTPAERGRAALPGSPLVGVSVILLIIYL